MEHDSAFVWAHDQHNRTNKNRRRIWMAMQYQKHDQHYCYNNEPWNMQVLTRNTTTTDWETYAWTTSKQPATNNTTINDNQLQAASERTNKQHQQGPTTNNATTNTTSTTNATSTTHNIMLMTNEYCAQTVVWKCDDIWHPIPFNISSTSTNAPLGAPLLQIWNVSKHGATCCYVGVS